MNENENSNPDAGALASPFTMTTKAAMTTATAAMMVAAPALVTGERGTPSSPGRAPQWLWSWSTGARCAQ